MSAGPRWMRREKEDDIPVEELRQLYEQYETLFSIRMHHAGTFSKYPGRKYVGGTFSYFDLVDRDYFSAYELDRMVEELGYSLDDKMYYHFKKPDSNLDYGLLALACDQDIRNLISYTDRYKVIYVYIEHGITTLFNYWRSPQQSKVVIEEIEESSSRNVVGIKKKVKKKLYLTWDDENVRKSRGDDGDENPFLDPFFTELDKNAIDLGPEEVNAAEEHNAVNDEVDVDMNDNVNVTVNYDVNADVNKEVNDAVNDEVVGLDEVVNVDMNKVVNSVNDDEVTDAVNSQPAVNDAVNDEENDDVEHNAVNEEVNDEEFEVDHDEENTESDDLDDEESEGSDEFDEEESDEETEQSDQNDDFVEDDQNTVHDVEVDMQGFNLKTDRNVEWDGITIDPNVGDVQVNDEVVGLNFDEYDSGSGSDVDRQRKLRLKKLRRSKVSDETLKSDFYVGQTFMFKKQITDLVRAHAVESRRELLVVKSDKNRVRVRCFGFRPGFSRKVEVDDTLGGKGKKCAETGDESISVKSEVNKVKVKVKVKGKGKVQEAEKDKNVKKSHTKKRDKPACPWTLHVSKGINEECWMVKTFIDDHKCLQCRELKICTSTFLANQISDTIQSNPGISGKALQQQLEQQFQLSINKMTAYRAKDLAMRRLRGDYQQQYSILRDYILELQSTNPGTTVKLDVQAEPNPNSPTRVFKRIYICLGSLKKGFKAGLRELVCLDGAFMKGPYPGQVLSAVGVDSNNGIYPIAYAIVEAETMDSWSWFLENFQADFELPANANFTFMTDRQKGLVPAIAKVFPCAEHRYCVRHIHENMKTQFKGAQFKDMLWKCATKTTPTEFEVAMEEFEKHSAAGHKWLSGIPSKHWARSQFSGRAHCDILLNNISESFNSKIVLARDQPIISCLEYIREYLMKRIVIVQQVIDKADGPLTPTGQKIFERIKSQTGGITVTWNGGHKYQCKGKWSEQCVVDVREKACSCRRWQLTGIPCRHAVAAIWNMGVNGFDVGIPEDWVHPAYKLETWKQMYSFKIEPISGITLWPRSKCPTKLLPPLHHTPVGRPKKKRTRGVYEQSSQGNSEMVRDGKLTRSGKTVTCGKCNNRGHNSKTCKGEQQRTSNSGGRRGAKSGVGCSKSGGKAGGSAVRSSQRLKKAGQVPVGSSQTCVGTQGSGTDHVN